MSAQIRTASDGVVVERDAALPTWFGVGGGADRLARPATADEVRACVEMDRELRVLGDGANLIVGDEGVGELVIELTRGELAKVDWSDEGTVVCGAGANLPRVIVEAVRRGLGGLEGLAGIPATVGGAVIMNAGGAFGQIADVVRTVRGVSREGETVELRREAIDFGYRRSGLNNLIVTEVELGLVRGDAEALRERLKSCMAYKKGSQPMADKSAGCVFKNPTLERDVDGLGESGQRGSAGKAIDRAGCKGMRVGGASVSDVHGNFVVTEDSATASDVLELMERVRDEVQDAFGVVLENEVVVWRRDR